MASVNNRNNAHVAKAKAAEKAAQEKAAEKAAQTCKDCGGDGMSGVCPNDYRTERGRGPPEGDKELPCFTCHGTGKK